jgi:hypothetical protein
MSSSPTSTLAVSEIKTGLSMRWRARARRWLDLASSVVVAFVLLGSANLDTATATRYHIDGLVAEHNWDLVAWEFDAIGRKLSEAVQQPAAALSVAEQVAHVQGYLARARTISELEAEVEAQYSQLDDGAVDATAATQERLATLRAAQEGLGWGTTALPPVWFTFTEPPMKMVVSPRGRIMTTHYAMLQPGVPAVERERIEQAILADANLSAYVTTVGGLGAYPTLVIDRASLEWVISTVAHEWVHNYLTLFPLGINYSTSSDLTIMNETISEIVGDEIGQRVLEQHYPAVAQAVAARAAAVVSGEAPPPAFDFRKEMRHTREIVDQFLALGWVEDAEEYMEIRRLLFVENGYAIRKLNQAYFAFHGSYGTGAAATSPLGPKLEELRSLTPDVRTFLETVRGLTSPEELERVLAAWRVGEE